MGNQMIGNQMGMNGGNWWNMESEEDKEAYMKWCEERKMKRENMVAQWRMCQSQLKQVEEYDESMNKYTEMKIKYMFSLTMDYLKFCKCSDNTADLGNH